MTEQVPICPCCSAELYRIGMSENSRIHLATYVLNAPLDDVQALMLQIFELMHTGGDYAELRRSKPENP